MSAREALGIDIGGVIIDRVSEDDAAPTPRDYGTVPAVDGAFDAIARLVRQRFETRVWLVSRVDEPRETVLLDWLERHDFFGATGVSRSQVRFCRHRHDKVAICRELGVTHFVDDRLEVLGHMVGAVPHLFWLPSRADDAERFRQFLPHVHPARRWIEIADAILTT